MKAERRVEQLQSKSVYESYVLPDGLSCEWIYIPDNLTASEGKDIADSAAILSTRLETQVRITQNSGASIEEIAALIQASYKNTVSSGKTSYFEVDAADFSQQGTLSWSHFESQYQFNSLKEIPEVRDTVKALMLESFPGNREEIEKHFDISIRIPGNDMYVVRDTKENKVTGSFLLKYIPALREVQLHSVAGRSTDARVSQANGKLPILMAAVLKAIDLQYPQRIIYGLAQNQSLDGGVDRLTFSASSVAHLYQALGFQTSTRQGLVVHPIQAEGEH